MQTGCAVVVALVAAVVVDDAATDGMIRVLSMDVMLSRMGLEEFLVPHTVAAHTVVVPMGVVLMGVVLMGMVLMEVVPIAPGHMAQCPMVFLTVLTLAVLVHTVLARTALLATRATRMVLGMVVRTPVPMALGRMAAHRTTPLAMEIQLDMRTILRLDTLVLHTEAATVDTVCMDRGIRTAVTVLPKAQSHVFFHEVEEHKPIFLEAG